MINSEDSSNLSHFQKKKSMAEEKNLFFNQNIRDARKKK